MPNKEDNKNPNTTDKGTSGTEPKNYKPLTVHEKSQWNDFLRFLYQKGYYGNKDLDTGTDKTDALLDLYRSKNPSFSITKEQVPMIQYEINMLQNGMIPDDSGKFQNISNTAFGKIIPTLYKNRTLSPVDGRIGSLTSTQAYPIAASRDYNKNWGTNYWDYIHFTDSVASTRNNKNLAYSK